jgi:hypothetical protein
MWVVRRFPDEPKYLENVETVNKKVGYLAVWKVLDEMVVSLKRKEVTIPADVISDLRSARTMIRIFKADPKEGETAEKVEGYLGKTEAYLVTEAEKRFGREYANEWLRRIDEAARKTVNEGEYETRFIPGVPRRQKWIRLTPSAELPIERLKFLAEESDLSYSVQADGGLLVFGRDEILKSFVKKIAARYRLKAGRTPKTTELLKP